MRMISRALLCAAVSFVVGSNGIARAGTITFWDPISDPRGIQQIDNLEPFKITVDSNGVFARNFVNLSGKRFTDFHFETTTVQSMPLMGFDISASRKFEDAVGTSTSLDMFIGSTGNGISNETVFSIVIAGAEPDTMFTATPTIPIPATLPLLISGLLAAGFAARRKKVA